MTGRGLLRGAMTVVALTVLIGVFASTPVITGAGASTPGESGTAGTAAAVASDGVSLSLETTDGSAPDGGEVTVEFTLTNEGDERAVAPVVSVGDLPEGWDVVDNSSESGTYRSSTREWLWFTLAPEESVTASITIEVPENATGVHEIPVTADDRDNHTAEAVATVDAGSGGPGGGSGLPTGLLLPAAGVLGVLLVGGGIYWYRSGGTPS